MRRLLVWPSTRLIMIALLGGSGLALALMVYLQSLNAALAPYDIVAFEFAWTAARAGEMLAAWGGAGAAAARQSLLVDYAFMPAYAVSFAALTLLAARAARERFQPAGLWLTIAPLAAALFDAVENTALLTSLPPGAPADGPAFLAAISAAIKFGLLAACLLYWLLVLAIGRRKA